MEETRRRTDLAPGALALLPWPAGPLPKQEGLPRFVDEAPAPGAVPHGAQDGVQLLRAAPQNLQAGLAGSGARAAESPRFPAGSWARRGRQTNIFRPITPTRSGGWIGWIQPMKGMKVGKWLIQLLLIYLLNFLCRYYQKKLKL